MTDKERIESLEAQLSNLQTELTDLKLIVAQLSRSAEIRRESTQAAVDGLQNSLKLIFANIRVPNVTWRPDARHVID